MLPIFTKRAQRELVQHPKFYLLDAGVFAVLRPRGVLDAPTEIQGLALEGAEKHQLAYWRTRGGLEVDFIVYGPKGLCAIEVKNSTKVHASDLKSLEAFSKDYPVAKPILLDRLHSL